MLHRDPTSQPAPVVCHHGFSTGWKWVDAVGLWCSSGSCPECIREHEATRRKIAQRRKAAARQAALDAEFGGSGFGEDCEGADFRPKDWLRPGHAEILAKVDKWVVTASDESKPLPYLWMFLVGPPGTGKTYIVAAAYRAFRLSGIPVTYHRASDLWARIKSAAYGHGSKLSLSDAVRKMVGNAKVLLLDDLIHLSGGLKGKDYEILFSLIDELWRRRIPLIWASQWPLDSENQNTLTLRKLVADPITKENPVYDRIRQLAAQHVMNWKSYREDDNGPNQKDLFGGGEDAS